MTENDITLEGAGDARQVVKDWEWWSDFLQLNYYSGPDEARRWGAAARSVAETIDLQPGMRVLDLGSGSGEMTMRLAMRGADAVGVERSAMLVQHCRQIAAARGVNATFIAADMFEYEADAPFDAVLSLNTSFGYGSDEQNRTLIDRIGRWLKPGGYLFIDVVAADTAESFGQWSDTLADGTLIVDNTYDADEQIMTSHPAWIAPDHEAVYTADVPEVVRIYTRAQMEEMMRSAGLEPRLLDKAMGRTFRQTKEGMLATWAARKMP